MCENHLGRVFFLLLLLFLGGGRFWVLVVMLGRGGSRVAMQPQAAAAVAGEKGGEMKYHSLSRRELQALCKEYHIPANKSNVAMAQALAALHNTTVSSIASILHSQTI